MSLVTLFILPIQGTVTFCLPHHPKAQYEIYVWPLVHIEILKTVDAHSRTIKKFYTGCVVHNLESYVKTEEVWGKYCIIQMYVSFQNREHLTAKLQETQ